MMKKTFALIAMAIALTASSHVMAHGAKASHGGIVQSANDLNFELVAKDNKAIIHVTDHEEEESTAGATGKLTVLNGAEKTEVALEPAGSNLMMAKSDIKLAKGTKVIASITFANKSTVNVRFVVK